MEDIHNKEQRKALMDRFLRAETSPEEEQSLRNFFLQFQGTLSEEEEEFRTLLLAVTSSPRFAPLSEEKVQEFDRLTHLRSWRVMFRRTVLSLSAAAALLTAVWWLLPRTEENAAPVSLVSVPPASSVPASQPASVSEETASVPASSVLALSPASATHARAAVVPQKNGKKKAKEQCQNVKSVANAQAKTPSIGETMQRVLELESMTGKQIETCDLRVAGDAIIVTTQHSDDTSSLQLVTRTTEEDGTAIFFFNTTETEI